MNRARCVLGVTATAVAAMFCVAVRAADAPAAGYVGKGTIVVRGALPGTTTPIDVDGDLAFEQRGSVLRLDVLDVSLPAAGAVGAALATQLFPAGGISAVYDRSAATYTVWSNASRKYYTSGANGATSAAPTPAPQATASPASSPFGFEKSLRELTALNLTLSLAGHGPINGHPATGLNYLFTRTTASGDTTDLHGTVQFADDLDGVPVQLSASFKNKYVPETSMRADITQLTKGTPADADFQPPAGFARTTTLGDVIGKTLHS